MTQFQIADFKFSGKTAVVVLILALAIGGYRVFSMNDVQNPDVLKLVEQELVNEWRREVMPAYLDTMRADPDLVESDLDTKELFSSGLEVHRLRASRPIFSFSSNERVVYEATYSIKNADGDRVRGTKYYEVEHFLIGNPQMKRDSSKVGFYMNFI